MTKRMEQKIRAIKAVVGESDSGEIWIDKTGEKVPINRSPIDWAKCIKPMYTIREIKDDKR